VLKQLKNKVFFLHKVVSSYVTALSYSLPSSATVDPVYEYVRLWKIRQIMLQCRGEKHLNTDTQTHQRDIGNRDKIEHP
jgi:hypothetical protein